METLTQGRADIIVEPCARRRPDTGFGFARLRAILNWCLLSLRIIRWFMKEEPLSRQTIKRFRAIVVGDSVHSSRSNRVSERRRSGSDYRV